MSGITYPLLDAIEAAKAILPHVSTDDITPVIAHAKLTSESWVATDRYTVARYEITYPEDRDYNGFTDGAVILLPREAVEWVAKIAASKLRSHKLEEYRLMLDNDSETVRVSILDETRCTERSQAFDLGVGNFPPIERLIETWEPSDLAVINRFAPKHLEKITGYAKRFKGEPISWESGAGSSSRKPGPMKVTFRNLTCLIQPNLNLDK